ASFPTKSRRGVTHPGPERVLKNRSMTRTTRRRRRTEFMSRARERAFRGTGETIRDEGPLRRRLGRWGLLAAALILATATPRLSAAATAPNTPSDPSPAHGAVDVELIPTLTWSGGDPDSPATGDLGTARYGAIAELLGNGKVLVAGGYNNGAVTSAELYDPATGTWSSTGSMSSSRWLHTGTMLASGLVLVTGGTSNAHSAELYDPASETWTVTGSLHVGRRSHRATLLADGRVL
ncbi:MAG: hypothetical protein GY856_14325, partial [bacterium]|nr:hypothetical protein [bacterium]